MAFFCPTERLIQLFGYDFQIFKLLYCGEITLYGICYGLIHRIEIKGDVCDLLPHIIRNENTVYIS